ncbi:MAG: S8 family serine peptidase [Methylococcales bacterium]
MLNQKLKCISIALVFSSGPTFAQNVTKLAVIPIQSGEKQTSYGLDPTGYIHSGVLKDAQITQYQRKKLSLENISTVQAKSYKKQIQTFEKPPSKLHPALRKRLTNRERSQTETVIINFKENLAIPPFPIPSKDMNRDKENYKRLRSKAESIITKLQNRRTQYYEKIEAELSSRHDVKVVQDFWLINAVVAIVPLSEIKALSQREDVLYIEPENDGSKPPDDSVAEGRFLIKTDPYFNLGQTTGYIGLLDTGLRFTHTLFDTPSNIDFGFDCTDGVCDSAPNPSDDCWNHGTSTAAIISGNNNLGNDRRGVSRITLDSFKVYPGGCGGLNTTATVEGFQKAVAILDRVIVAEMQGGGNEASAISTAADAAFDAGAVIIAANGNNGPNAGTVNAPANAHKVIGVGAYFVESLDQYNNQSRGPASDNRIKPDIQTPTLTRTASSASDIAIKVFSGTSGATPYAAGAAALTRNWMRGINFSIDPGHVYSRLILSGQSPYPFNNTEGAGRLELGTGGRAWWGKANVTNHMTVNIPISVNSGDTKIEGALWWPENVSDTHNDIDLKLVDPNGVERDSSISISSVFERATYSSSNLQPGTWHVRIYGWSVPTSESVYWSARTR